MDDTIINNIVDLISYGFYPAYITIPYNKNENVIDKLINYFTPKKYSNEFFRFEITNNKIIYEIINDFEPVSNIYAYIYGSKYYEIDIVNNKFYTNGKINLRHILMLNDFANMNLNIDYIEPDEFYNYKQEIKQELSNFSYDDLIKLIKNTFEKTISYKYNYNINVWKAPNYNIDLINLEGYKKYNNNDDEIKSIKNRIWYTGDGYFSQSTQIFSLKSTYYSCLMNKKLYTVDIDNLESCGRTYKLIPYRLLFKYEGGMNFEYCNYTYWNKLLNDLPPKTLRNYFSFNCFELINSYEKSNSYHAMYIPIDELILFCKILENEGAYLSYHFDKNIK